MSLEDAADAILLWLQRYLGVRIAARFAKELEAQHFRVTVFQVVVAPGSEELGTARRIFEVVPLDIADCYEVKEIAA